MRELYARTTCGFPRAEWGGQLEGYEASSVMPLDAAAWSGWASLCWLLELPASALELSTASRTQAQFIMSRTKLVIFEPFVNTVKQRLAQLWQAAQFRKACLSQLTIDCLSP